MNSTKDLGGLTLGLGDRLKVCPVASDARKVATVAIHDGPNREVSSSIRIIGRYDGTEIVDSRDGSDRFSNDFGSRQFPLPCFCQAHTLAEIEAAHFLPRPVVLAHGGNHEPRIANGQAS